MAFDPTRNRDPVQAIGSPEDPKAIDPDDEQSVISLLKGIMDAVQGGAPSAALATITFIIDGGGVVITTGVKGDLEIGFDCEITRATLLADQAGSIVVDVWADVFGNYPPTVLDTITAAAKPTIVAATKSQDSVLTGWTTLIPAGTTLRFNVDSVSTIQRVTLSLDVEKL